MFLRIFLPSALSAFLFSCAPRTATPASPLDTPPRHYKRGMALFEAGDLPAAQREFERARSLDPHFAGALVGGALIAMEQGDFWEARKQVQKAIYQKGDFVDAYIALGRIATREGLERNEPKKKWLQEARAAYRKAIDKAPDYPAAYYYQGETYLQALDLPAARMAFSRIMEINRGPLVEKALRRIETIQRVERAAPGTEWGLKIGLKPAITRAELAVLLLEELKLDELMRQRRRQEGRPGFRPPSAASEPLPRAGDIEYSWARPWIEKILALGLSGLELFPDHTFQPDSALTRAEYALVNQSILVLISGDGSLATRYLGEPSRFPDVRGDLYAYNAIALSTERGIMAADKLSGRFRPDDSVSGAEALLMIRELQNAVRMEF